MKVEIIGGPYKVAYDGVHIIEVMDGQLVDLLPETCEAWIKYGKAKSPGLFAPENKMIAAAPEPEPERVPEPPVAKPHKKGGRR